MVVVCSLLAVCSVSAQISRREGTDGQAAIYRLPPFERAVCCTKFFEGWHSENITHTWDMGTNFCRAKGIRHVP